MLIIGLAGGIASGKSFVADEFLLLGAHILDADTLGHEVLKAPDVIDDVRSLFGDQVVDESGHLIRSEIASLVFGKSQKALTNLTKLEQITHPKITSLMRARIAEHQKNGVPAVVLDAAVMFKTGWDKICDKIVFIKTEEKVRLERAKKRGWTEKHFKTREASQLPLELKLSKSTDMIENNLESKNLNQQILALWKSWNLPLPIDESVN